MHLVIVRFSLEGEELPEDFWKSLRANMRIACRHSGAKFVGISTGMVPDVYMLEDPDDPPLDFK